MAAPSGLLNGVHVGWHARVDPFRVGATAGRPQVRHPEVAAAVRCDGMSPRRSRSQLGALTGSRN